MNPPAPNTDKLNAWVQTLLDQSSEDLRAFVRERYWNRGLPYCTRFEAPELSKPGYTAYCVVLIDPDQTVRLKAYQYQHVTNHETIEVFPESHSAN